MSSAPRTTTSSSPGYVWVGVSAQKVGIEGYPPEAPRYSGRQLPIPPLKEWDAERYGSLVHPGDRYSFDLFSQAGTVVRSGAVTGGVPVERMVATGASQSGARLTTYINAIHPLVHVFDAFVPTITAGWGTRLDDAPPGVAINDPARRMTPSNIRDDIDEPVMIVNSECETIAMYPTRRADDDKFRFWEVAGTPHVVAVAEAPEPREHGRVDNALSYRPVLSSAYRAVHRWMVDGTPPPSFPTIEFTDDTTVARDEHGNAIGGVRLPEMAAPIAEYHGRDDAPGFLMLYGWARPFSREELRRAVPVTRGLRRRVPARHRRSDRRRWSPSRGRGRSARRSGEGGCRARHLTPTASATHRAPPTERHMPPRQ